MQTADLIKKYNVATPRYTSYPTVPYWDNELDEDSWRTTVRKSFETFNEDTGISVYIHLPYCESLCTYCGCNKRITKNHSVEDPYISTVLKEWKMYRNGFDSKPILKQLHLGGGTPTFFSPDNLAYLVKNIQDDCVIAEGAEFSFEGHPSNTTYDHLHTLNLLGFDRVSYGIQDFDPKVQKVINRFQSIEEVNKTVNEAKTIGYNSINFDLVYGLPFQHSICLKETISEVIRLRPDRIAFYSYAHVPWVAKGQRLYSAKDLPSGEEKLALYQLGKSLLTNAGYVDIGMDHFALETDELCIAMNQERLQRNFMGYTTNNTKLMIGLGVSSISDSFYGYAQNDKTIEGYKRAVNNNCLPTVKGHLLSEQEIKTRTTINQLMCNNKTEWGYEKCREIPEATYQKILSMQDDGLVSLTRKEFLVTPKGRNYVRNICAALDQKLWKVTPHKEVFSKAI